MLGPLVNPSFPQNQLVGVFNLEIARIYNYLLQQSDKKYTILHSLDGYDEISLTDNFKAISNKGEKLFSPESIGFNIQKQADIFGGSTIKNAAKIFVSVLENNGTEHQKNAVLANSSFAIQCLEPNKNLAECKAIAIESLESGKAIQSLKKLTA